MPPDRVFTHALGHVKEDIQGTIDKALENIVASSQMVEKSTAEAISGCGDQVSAALQELKPPHASFKEMQEHVESCPTCKANLGQWKASLQPEHEKVLAPAPPEPPKAEETPPAAPVAPPSPKRLSWPSPSDVPGSALSQGAYGVERVDSPDGVHLRARDEESGQEAVAAGVVPPCRWVPGADGAYACENQA